MENWQFIILCLVQFQFCFRPTEGRSVFVPPPWLCVLLCFFPHALDGAHALLKTSTTSHCSSSGLNPNTPNPEVSKLCLQASRSVTLGLHRMSAVCLSDGRFVLDQSFCLCWWCSIRPAKSETCPRLFTPFPIHLSLNLMIMKLTSDDKASCII